MPIAYQPGRQHNVLVRRKAEWAPAYPDAGVSSAGF
ncbi:hypothetical protein B14911_11522 [Bacillus sp. NRRL B-14911]|nr:hypothetical protein B14911_11522 [Bacillus sp. NRRL B-14911]